MWTRTALKRLLRDVHAGTFPQKPQIEIPRSDGTKLECYQTYANRLFAVLDKDGNITKVYYGLGFWSNVANLTKLGYRTQKFWIDKIDYLEIFPIEVK